MVANVFKVILLLFCITGVTQLKAQNKRKNELQQWKDSVETTRLMAKQERHFMDSLIHVKAVNALKQREFVDRKSVV